VLTPGRKPGSREPAVQQVGQEIEGLTPVRVRYAQPLICHHTVTMRYPIRGR
jgi:hypothetical protein